jgi:16S rRNA (guanine527-N7)-methyltransferase
MIERLAEVSGRGVSRETAELLSTYAELLRVGAATQNLVSRGTLGSLWERHILDSAQLVRLEPRAGASWVDIGSGAGLPGIVIATLVTGPVLLVEPRRLRAEFLERTVSDLGLSGRVQISTHLSTRNTVWVLPKGRNAESELAQARRNWHCDASSVPSCTDPDSRILLLRNVKARGGR